MDKLTPAQRRHCMSSIRGKDTKPEILVRKGLHARGFRFRLQERKLPGKPDLTLPKYGVAVMVNGCFWHGHEECKYYRLPKTNVEFWQAKIERNKKRDIEEQHRLASLGWHCITVWECQLKPKIRQQTLEALAYTLNHIYLQDHARPYSMDEESLLRVAEE